MVQSSPYPPFIVGLVIGIPSVILYVTEAIVLIKHWKRLNSTFFRLFLVRFALNILNYLCSYMYARFGRVGLLYELFSSLPSIVLAFGFTFYYYSFLAENFSTMFILVNRLTSILSPLSHIKIWKYLLPASIFVIIIVPLPFTAPMLAYKVIARLQADNYTFTMYYEQLAGYYYLEPSMISAVSAVLFCIICGGLNIATVVIYNSNAYGKTIIYTNQKQQKMESRLTVYAIITFLAHLCMALYMIAICLFCCYLGEDFFPMFLTTFNQMPWVSDLTTIVVPSWVLLWASKTIRGLVAKEIRLSKWPLCGSALAKISPESSVTKTAKTIHVKGPHLAPSSKSPHLGSRATTPTYNAWMT
ncbi:srg family chemoreceptor domain-containing protein [Ditylenchus destructor]|nr:srg family chemoreceptor domain-containing protein [Ditylenchus destructor]